MRFIRGPYSTAVARARRAAVVKRRPADPAATSRDFHGGKAPADRLPPATTTKPATDK